MLPTEVGILCCSLSMIAIAINLVDLIGQLQKKGSGEPSMTFRKISNRKSTQIRKEDQLQNRQIAHSYQTAENLILAFKALHRAGVAPEKSRAKLPAGVSSVQQLTDDQARTYLRDLRNLYMEAIRSKRMQVA